MKGDSFEYSWYTYLFFPTETTEKIRILTSVLLFLVTHRGQIPVFSGVSDRKNDVIFTYAYQELGNWAFIHHFPHQILENFYQQVYISLNKVKEIDMNGYSAQIP